MRRICINKPFLAMLSAAFMILQWSSAHIHLAEQHDHGGARHQHEVISHHHADAVDVAEDQDVSHASHGDGQGIVELDYECTSCSSKILYKLASVMATTAPLLPQSEAAADRISVFIYYTVRGPAPFSTPAVRAPPAVT